MKESRILVVDDHSVVRRGLRAFLEDHAGWKVCGEAATCKDGIEKAKELKPDIVLLDINMPDLSGLEATREILTALPQTKILIFTMYDSEEVVRKILGAGAFGYMLKSDADHSLLAALQSLNQDQPYFTPKVARMVLEGFLQEGTPAAAEIACQPLTQRQVEVVRLLAQGHSNKEVASVLNISIKTVESHRSNIMRRLELSAFSDLVRYAMREKIVA
jgi:DNA-binding NarL/FixJ family response regulator